LGLYGLWFAGRNYPDVDEEFSEFSGVTDTLVQRRRASGQEIDEIQRPLPEEDAVIGDSSVPSNRDVETAPNPQV
jgi:hypothetical protein